MEVSEDRGMQFKLIGFGAAIGFFIKLLQSGFLYVIFYYKIFKFENYIII